MPQPAATPKTNLSTRTAARVRLSAFALLVCAFVALTTLHPIHSQAEETTSQQPTTQEPTTREQTPDDEIVRVNTDLFVFPIRVRDKRGASTILTEHDLLLKDEDHVTAGLSLYHGADRVAVVFALDGSGSLREIVSQQREAALALAGRFGEKSQVAVIRFAETPSLVAPFASDTAAAREAFNFPARGNQHTAIFDAALAAVNTFAGLPRVRSERRIIVLLSDGLDNASSVKARTVIEAALQSHVSFYVIHLPLFEPRDGRLAVRSPAKGFHDLAEKTGGKYFLVGNAGAALAPQADRANNDLTPVFQAIEDDLRSQYLLGWYAGEGSRDGRSHRFTISFPAGVEFQIGGFKYARSQEFFHGLPGKPKKDHK
jgi:Ca-activated chloride channel family protein